ncbi:MAG: hypothetical protein WBC04_12275 [Candidatus Acidiferrales bacterium]
MKSAKQIVYWYNGDLSADEVEVDLIGGAPIPQKGDLIIRQGIEWKVVNVIVEESVLTLYRVFLTNQ